jgi:hypothetical protein
MITPISFGLLVLNGEDLAIEIIGATRDDALAIAVSTLPLGLTMSCGCTPTTKHGAGSPASLATDLQPGGWPGKAGEWSAICLSTANISITFMYTLRRRAAAWAQRCCTRREVSALDVLLS